MTDAERAELAALLTLRPDLVGTAGYTVDATGDRREEFVARAQGREPEVNRLD
jgi:hypothetical protein